MMIFRSFPLLFFLFCLTANAQKTEITGLAKEWASKEIRLLVEKDPVTNTFTQIDVDTISEEGNFTLKADTSNSGIYWLAVQRFKSPIWLSPGTDYSISLIPKPENILVNTWQNGTFEYAFLTLDSNDVNKVLSDFDTKYYDFYLDNARFIGTSQLKSKVAEYEKEVKIDSDRPFIKTYQDYSIAEMKLSAGYKKDELYNTYLKNRPVDYHNLSYYNFFNLFYADYFQSYDLKFGGATIANRLKKGLPADSLSILLEKDSFLKNDTIRQLVMLKSIAEVYSNVAYPLNKLAAIVNLISENPSTREIGEIANRLKRKLDYPLIGSDFKSVSSTLTPEYIIESDTLPTLIMVTVDGSMASEKEAQILKTLFEKYQNVVHFVEVSIGTKPKPFERPWPIYFPGDKMQFLDDFKVYGFPHFIWVDGDQKIRENGIEKPSEGLETRLFKIQSDADNKNRIKVGQ